MNNDEDEDVNDTARRAGIDAVRRRHDEARRFGGPISGKNGGSPELGNGIPDRFDRAIGEPDNSIRVKPESKASKPESKASKAFPFILQKDIDLQPKQFLIDGFLGLHEISAFYGSPDSGKSTVVIHAACCLAANVDFGGRHVKQGLVVYVAAERGGVVKRRIKAWCIEHEVSDIPLAIIDHAVDLRTSKDDANRIVATVKEIEAHCGYPAVFIIFDTLNRVLAGGDENSPKDMGAVIASLDHIFRATGAHVTVIHHVPVDRGDRLRGHGLLLGALDMTVRVAKEDGTVHAGVDVGKDLVDRPNFAFKFKSVLLATDARGDTTAPVLEPITGTAHQRRDAGDKKQPKIAKIALDALREVSSEQGVFRPESEHVPRDAKIALIKDWRERACLRGISTGGERAAQRAFKRAVEHLVAEGTVKIWDGYVWVP